MHSNVIKLHHINGISAMFYKFQRNQILCNSINLSLNKIPKGMNEFKQPPCMKNSVLHTVSSMWRSENGSYFVSVMVLNTNWQV